MSKITHQIDAAELQKGKDKNKVLANNAETKKALGPGEEVKVDGEVKGPSKKDLKKAAKKE